jgi:hypothetical protein
MQIHLHEVKILQIHNARPEFVKKIIVRYTAREEIPRKFPREPYVFLIIVTSLDSTDNKHDVHYETLRLAVDPTNG